MELAAQSASEHAEVAQKRYTDYYNLRAREKSFIDREKVVVLAPDSSNKLYSRWRLGTINPPTVEVFYCTSLVKGGVKSPPRPLYVSLLQNHSR